MFATIQRAGDCLNARLLVKATSSIFRVSLPARHHRKFFVCSRPESSAPLTPTSNKNKITRANAQGAEVPHYSCSEIYTVNIVEFGGREKQTDVAAVRAAGNLVEHAGSKCSF